MSLDLAAQIKSLKVTDETLLWLRWIALDTGKSHAEIARDALHAVAVNEMGRCKHRSKLLASLEPREGNGGDTTGKYKVLPLQLPGEK